MPSNASGIDGTALETCTLPFQSTPTVTTAQDAPTRAHQHARALVLRYGWNAMAYQILNPGISLWFSPDNQAVVGYVDSHRYRIVAGAPICAPSSLTSVAETFEADTQRAGLQVCYFGAQDRLIMTLDTHRPLAALLLGAQPVWRPQEWPGRVTSKSSLRSQLARARNKQVRVSQWTAHRATNHPDLQRCLREWLQRRALPPMHFLVEPDTLGYLADRNVFVAERLGQIIGFLVASPVPWRNGWLIEQIIRTRAAPNGTTELLLDTAMRHLAAGGARYVSLGLSALSQRAGQTQTPQPLHIRALLALVRSHGQRFYNFDGLEAFRAKFLPQWWEPIYAISRERAVSLPMMYAIAGAFGSTSPLLFVGHGLLRAFAHEAARFKQRLHAQHP
jgi:phosphatidylglycerol lysyltransferase